MKIKNLSKHILYLLGPGISLYSKIILRFRKRYTPFTLKFFGKNISVLDSGSFLGVYQEIFVNEIYKFTPSSKKSKPIIIDCGSHIGVSIMYYKRYLPDSEIISFEADPDIYQVLKNNIESVSLKDIQCHNKAVWDNNDGIQFTKEGGASGTISTFRPETQDNIVVIPTVRLKNILEEFESIDFLKMDIEGAEVEVMRDCANSLDKVERIFIEYHSYKDRNQELDALLTILNKNNFRYHITEAYASVHPFVHVEPMMGMDLLLNIYAWK